MAYVIYTWKCVTDWLYWTRFYTICQWMKMMKNRSCVTINDLFWFSLFFSLETIHLQQIKLHTIMKLINKHTIPKRKFRILIPLISFYEAMWKWTIYTSRWVGIPMRFTEQNHDDVIKWKHFPRYWPFVRGIHRSPVDSPHKGQWHGALMFSLICARINGWVNNREAGDLRRHRTHYDVIVLMASKTYPAGSSSFCITALIHRLKGSTMHQETFKEPFHNCLIFHALDIYWHTGVKQ